VHTIDSTDVTWCIERGDCGIKHCYLPIVLGAFIKRYVSGILWVVCVLLLVKELLKYMIEVVDH